MNRMTLFIFLAMFGAMQADSGPVQNVKKENINIQSEGDKTAFDQVASYDFRIEFENFVSKTPGLYKLVEEKPSLQLIINKKNFPKLFAMINRLADKMSIDMPQDIAVSFDKNEFASVLSYQKVTGKFNLNKVLLIGKSLFCNCSDVEIEAAMAHELAHIALEHLEEACSIDNMYVPIAGCTGIVVFACGGSSLRQSSVLMLLGAIAGYYGIKFLNECLFSRDREKEADLYALKILGRENALISLLSLLSLQSCDTSQFSWLNRIFSTHPSIQKRIQYIQAAMVKKKF